MAGSGMVSTMPRASRASLARSSSSSASVMNAIAARASANKLADGFDVVEHCLQRHGFVHRDERAAATGEDSEICHVHLREKPQRWWGTAAEGCTVEPDRSPGP